MDEKPEHDVQCVSFKKKKDDEWCTIADTDVDAGGRTNYAFNDFNQNQSKASLQFVPGDQSKEQKRVQLVWKDVKYSVPVRHGLLGRETEPKQILQQMSGVLNAGSMTALMGPSGAGKSSLLNCMAGKVQCSGSITIRFPGARSQTDLRIGFVPQTEHLFTQFTVKETVLFASRLNNARFSGKEHAMQVQQTLRNLDLENKRNDRLWSLSGGQLKRVSIAVELIYNPLILMLDEPTSGLDSDNSEKLVLLLKDLTNKLGQNAPAIIATIHQPSVDAFLMFDEIYLLNRFGSNIYCGSPHKVMDYVVSFGFERKKNTNPAEYMIEIANAKYGTENFPLMAAKADETFVHREKTDTGVVIPLASVDQKRSASFFMQFILLFWRNLTAYCTKSPAAAAQMIVNLVSFIFMINMRVSPIGLESGCWSKIQNLSVPTGDDDYRKSFISTIGQNMWDIDFKSLMIRSADCSMFMYIMTIYFLYIPATAAVTYFPLEVKTVRRELSNNWYSVAAYFFAKILSNPLILVIANLPAIAYVYFGGAFPADQYFRFGMLFGISLLLAAVWDARGFFFSVVFKGDALRAVLATNSILFVFIFLSGFYVKYEGLNDFVKPIADLCDIKYGFSSIMTTVYGYDRCITTPEFVSNNLLAKKDMTRAVNKMWSTFNMTLDDGRRLALLLGMDKEYFDPVVTAIDKYVGPYVPNEIDGDLQQSFVLHFNRVRESDMMMNLTFLVGALVTTQIGIYLALRFTTRSHKL
jgi:ABC-type multidrug transport system ATPase subunit